MLVLPKNSERRRGLWFALAAAAGLAVAAACYFAATRQSPPVAPASSHGTATSRPPLPVAPVARFVDVTSEAGITFVHESGSEGEYLFPETMGGGLTVLDYNSDGRPDLLFVNGTHWPGAPAAEQPDKQPTSALYRNEGNLRFTDVTRAAGLDFSFYGMGAAAGDFDNDGDPDLYFTGLGPCRLFENVGGKFRDVTAAAGVAGERDAWSTGAGWFDYDLDGDLDLFVCNYVRWSRQMNLERAFRPERGVRGSLMPQNFEGSQPKLYRNEGGGLFSDVSRAAGVEVTDERGQGVAKSLGLCFADLNADQRLDVVIANDTVRNFALISQRGDRFVEEGITRGIAFGPDGNARAGMGIDIGDYRNDGGWGIAIGNFAGESTALFTSSRSRELFSDEAAAAGIAAETRSRLTFGVLLWDYDLDGRLDLLTANGHVDRGIAQQRPEQSYEQPVQLFWNCGRSAAREFVPVTPGEAGSDLFNPLPGRGAVCSDLDDDGDPDLVLTGIDVQPRVLRNDQQLGHHWVRLKLVGSRASRDAIGALVELQVAGTWQRRMVNPTRSYLSQCETTLTFGLGEHEAVEEARIVWPGGAIHRIENLAVNQETVIEQATAN
jgi:hypothetical protein